MFRNGLTIKISSILWHKRAQNRAKRGRIEPLNYGNFVENAIKEQEKVIERVKKDFNM